MSQTYQIKNTATMTYTYTIDSNRPPITKQIQDSAYNSLLIEERDCQETQTICDCLAFCACRRNICAIQTVDAWLNGIRSFTTYGVYNGRFQKLLIVQGCYITRIQYVTRKHRIRQYYHKKYFQSVIPLRISCPEISNVFVNCLRVANTSWKANRFYVGLQMTVNVQG